MHSFSRDLSRLNSDGESEKGSESSEESSSEEETNAVDDARNRVGQLPPIANSDSEDEPSSNHGLQANLNSTLSTMSLAPPPDAPATSNSRLGAMNAEKVAQARLERKMAQGAKKSGGAKVKGSGSDESEDENDNRKAGKMMKAADLGAPREMSRRERFVPWLLFPNLVADTSCSEQADKAAAKERYAKLHAAGKVILTLQSRFSRIDISTTRRQTKRRQISVDSPLFVNNENSPPPNESPKQLVSPSLASLC